MSSDEVRTEKNNGRELVLVSGFARGGTNIVWNLIASHPGILSTGFEFNEILGPRRTQLPISWKILIEAFALSGVVPPAEVRRYIESRVAEFAAGDMGNEWVSWRSPEERYNDDELKNLPICAKSVSSWPRDFLYGLLKRNFSLKYNKIVRSIFPQSRFVFVVRDPEAVCNGWMRRGCSPRLAGKWYRKIAESMLSEKRRKSCSTVLINFSDVISNPIGSARSLHKFCGLKDLGVADYRLKSKRVLREDGRHVPVKGSVDDMIWMREDEVSSFLYDKVDCAQKAMLSDEDRIAFFSTLEGVDKELLEACMTIKD